MDIIGVYLKEALGRAGCPVCYLLDKYEKSSIETILYEHVNDPFVREKFAESLGLCPYHAWRIKEIAYSNPLYGGLGIAVIYEHMLSLYLRSLQKGEKIEEKECYLCKAVEEKEHDVVETFAERLNELLEDYKNSEAVLCKRHYELINSLLGEDTSLIESLREIQVEKLESIRKKMRKFIGKFDYRSKEAPSKEEALAVLLAIESLKGLPLRVNLVKREKTRHFWRDFSWPWRLEFQRKNSKR
ncbi:DUF6062 family protein [Thermococcus litoralis]|uniref:DUF6062 family protein n=1 Tax=Thermococcus litoralis TaxID=2265 RepID=UPI0015C4F4DC|nr:DUF6062 family protein [Thermococcus litoralis]